MKKKQPFHVNPYVLVFVLVIAAGLSTYFIPPGTLEDGVYTPLPPNRVSFNSLFNILLAVPKGVESCASLIAILLVCTGAVEVLRRTGAVDAGICLLLERWGRDSGVALLVIIGTVASAMGAFLGWIDTTLPFIPLVSVVVLALGYDAIVAVGLVAACGMVGFTAGPTNLYTVGVCNSVLQSLGLLEGESIFTGMGFRVVLWAVYTVAALAYTLLYARKIRKDPTKSLMHGVEMENPAPAIDRSASFTARHALALLAVLLAMLVSVLGMQVGIGGVKWGQDHMTAAFLGAGLLAGFIGKMNAEQIAQAFLDGAKNSIGAGLILALARGVFWVLEEGNANATIAYAMSRLLHGLPPVAAAIGIAVLVTLINALIPSSSGKGALLGPILLPIAMELGLGSQTAVLAFQLGSGPTYIWWVTVGALYVCLDYGKVPVKQWLKFYTPLVGIIYAIGFAALAVAVAVGY